jgi:hypothetical protein
MKHVGVTNCPQRYAVLGQMLFERGANVLIPRMPKNGYADIETDALHHLTVVVKLLLILPDACVLGVIGINHQPEAHRVHLHIPTKRQGFSHQLRGTLALYGALCWPMASSTLSWQRIHSGCHELG